jgi:hypothetical protein
MSRTSKKAGRAMAAAIALLSIGLSAGAQTKEVGSGPNPFADCGIGAALFSETKWAAVTSNIIWDIGITAVISATASPETCSGKKVAAAVLIGTTYDRIAEDVAAGRGQHLTSVLNVLECKAERHGDAAQMIRTALTDAVSRADYAGQSRLEKASSLYGIVDRAVVASCST